MCVFLTNFLNKRIDCLFIDKNFYQFYANQFMKNNISPFLLFKSSINLLISIGVFVLIFGCQEKHIDSIVLDREDYQDQLQGFWMAQCIANCGPGDWRPIWRQILLSRCAGDPLATPWRVLPYWYRCVLFGRSSGVRKNHPRRSVY